MATYSPSKITKDGNTYNFTDANAVPRTGGAVMTGVTLGRNVDNGSIGITGGTWINTGATVGLFGKDSPDFPGCMQFSCTDNSNSRQMDLKPDGTWTWNGSACTVSSDRRIKDEISEIPDEILDAWESLEPKQYKLKSDLENDKDNAQIHYGWIAQEVESVIKGDRKGEVKNGLWLHEEWEEQKEVSHEEEYTEEVQTKSGEIKTVTKTRKVIDTPYRAKGDSYGLRYTECLVVECAYLRKKNKELQSQLDKLASRLDKLEGVQTK